MTRREQVLAAAVAVFQEGGPHALTHRAVDRAARVPDGTTSNAFRSRDELVGAVAREIARRRLAAPEGAVDEDLSLAWLDFVILAQRDPRLRRAIAPIRAEMLERLDGARTDDIPLTTPALAALLTGLELARAICPEPTSVRELIDALSRRTGAGAAPRA